MKNFLSILLCFVSLSAFSQNIIRVEVSGKIIVESNDINNILPSEVALLSDEMTEDIFYKKLVYTLRGSY